MPEQIGKEQVATVFQSTHLTLFIKCIKKNEPTSYGYKQLCGQRQWAI